MRSAAYAALKRITAVGALRSAAYAASAARVASIRVVWSGYLAYAQATPVARKPGSTLSAKKLPLKPPPRAPCRRGKRARPRARRKRPKPRAAAFPATPSIPRRCLSRPAAPPAKTIAAFSMAARPRFGKPGGPIVPNLSPFVSRHASQMYLCQTVNRTKMLHVKHFGTISQGFASSRILRDASYAHSSG